MRILGRQGFQGLWKGYRRCFTICGEGACRVGAQAADENMLQASKFVVLQ